MITLASTDARVACATETCNRSKKRPPGWHTRREWLCGRCWRAIDIRTRRKAQAARRSHAKAMRFYDRWCHDPREPVAWKWVCQKHGIAQYWWAECKAAAQIARAMGVA